VQNAVPLLLVFNPRSRAKTLPSFNRRYLHRAARNLAAALGALRETEEETGRRGFRVLRFLGRYDYEFRNTFDGVERHEMHDRHVFLLEPPADLPDRWSYRADDEEGDFWFEFSWVPLGADLRLAGEQHALTARIDEIASEGH